MSGAEELSTKAADERRRARLWLLQFIGEGKPRYATKSELREAAIRQLVVPRADRRGQTPPPIIQGTSGPPL